MRISAEEVQTTLGKSDHIRMTCSKGKPTCLPDLIETENDLKRWSGAGSHTGHPECMESVPGDPDTSDIRSNSICHSLGRD